MHPFFAILPLMLLMAVGGVLARFHFVRERFWDDLNKLIYYVLLPILIVGELANARENLAGAMKAWTVFALATLAIVPVAFLTSWMIRLPFRDWGVYTQAAFRSNLAFIGIPVMQFALGDLAATVIPTAILVFAPTMILYNVLSVALLQFCQHSFNAQAIWRAFIGVLQNPLVIASVIGLLWYLAPFGCPDFLTNTFSTLGSTAAPMALLCIGASFSKFPLQPTVAALLSGFLKVAALPFFAWLLMFWLPLSEVDRFVVFIFCASPTAAAAFIMAKAMGGDERLAAGSVVWATLLSIPSLMLIIEWFAPR